MTYSRLKLIVQSKDNAGDKPTTHEFVSGTFTDVESILNDVVSFLKHVNDGQSAFAEPDTDFSDVSSPNLPDFGRLTDDEDEAEGMHEAQPVVTQVSTKDPLDALMTDAPDLDVVDGIVDDEEDSLERIDETPLVDHVPELDTVTSVESSPVVAPVVSKPETESSFVDPIIDADQEPELQDTVDTEDTLHSQLKYDDDVDENYDFGEFKDEPDVSDSGVMTVSNFDELEDDFPEEAPY